MVAKLALFYGSSIVSNKCQSLPEIFANLILILIKLTSIQTNTKSHPGKIVERRWFERNKHIFPASRWEVVRVAHAYHHTNIAFVPTLLYTPSKPLPHALQNAFISMANVSQTFIFERAMMFAVRSKEKMGSLHHTRFWSERQKRRRWWRGELRRYGRNLVCRRRSVT